MKLEVVELTREHDEEVTRFLDSLAKESGSVLAYHYPFYRDVLETMGYSWSTDVSWRSQGRGIVRITPGLREAVWRERRCKLTSLFRSERRSFVPARRPD